MDDDCMVCGQPATTDLSVEQRCGCCTESGPACADHEGDTLAADWADQ